MKTLKTSPIYYFILTISFLLFGCTSGSNSTSPLINIQYATLNYSGAAPGSSTLITGIRGINSSSNVYISGIYTTTSANNGIGLIYTGPISGGGTWYALNYPTSNGVTVTGTSFYGPNNGTGNGNVQIAGSYATAQTGSRSLGLLYQGPLNGSGTWTTLLPTSPINVINTIAHSTMGGLLVGNYNSVDLNGRAFIYNINSNSYTELRQPGAVSTTAYGIWYNGGTKYTITGGFSNVNQNGLDLGYLVDWDSSTNTASNWTTYNYKNMPLTSLVSHFEGITTDGLGGYNLASDWTATNGSSGAAFVNIPRTLSGGFGNATWTDVAFPGSSVTSANTVYQNNILGVYMANSIVNGYVATLNFRF